MNLHEELEKIQVVQPLTSADVMGAVIRRSAIFPLTSIPAFFALGATVISTLFGGVDFFTTSALWMGAAAAISFLYNVTARRAKHAERAVFSHTKMAGLKQRRTLAQLQRHFLKVRTSGEEKQFREQGAKQLRISLEKFAAFQHVLISRFQRTELTFERYLGAGTEVFHHIIDNLNRILELLASIDSIDINHVRQRVQFMKAQSGLSESDQKELEALNKRMQSWQRQWERVSELLSQNEESLTAFTDTVAALNDIDLSQKERARVSSESAMRDLRNLAERAKSLSSPG